MYVAIIAGIVLLSGITCHRIAKRRGTDPVFWGVMGLVFGPFAIPFVFTAKPR